MDFATHGLLDGLAGPDRQARLVLLNRLERDGATPEELTAAVREDRLPLLLIERRLGGRHTAQELERQTGVPAEVMLRMRRLVGLSNAGEDDRVFSDEDVELARSTKLFLDAGFAPEALGEISRVLGEGMGRVAATVTMTFAQTFLRSGETELEVAERFDALAEHLTPAIAPVLAAAFNAHLREAIHRGMLSRTQFEHGLPIGAQEVAVCFADLVGFTRLGGELEVEELGGVAGHLAEIALDLTVPPVRLIKTIGDAVMFVCPDPELLVATALELVDAAEEDDLPSLRAGVAFGPAVQRSGDYFGHSVNLASRVTGAARPGSVLGTQAVRDLTPEAFDWSYAGRFKLKGIGEPEPLHRPHARPAGADGDETERAAETGRESLRTRREGRRRRRASR